MGYAGVPFGWEGKVMIAHTFAMKVSSILCTILYCLNLLRTSLIFSTEAPYALLPLALASHPCYHYVEYLDYYKPNSTSENLTSLYYVNDFERIEHFGQEISSYALENSSNRVTSIKK